MNRGQASVTRMRNLIHRRGLKMLLQAIDYLLYYQGLTLFDNHGLWTGVGAAWTWQGQAGQPLDESAVASIQAFLSADKPRIRAVGGARFDSSREPSQEWQEFGSYLFMLPR